jgi:hypothetical protein
MKMPALDLVHSIMQWIVAPVAAFVWFLHNKVQAHSTDIAVLKAQTANNKQAHDREMKEIREMHDKIFQKLNSIEEALRK